MNLAMSILFARNSKGDDCLLYFINILIDTTVGVAVEYFVLVVLTCALQKISWHPGDYLSGEYRTDSGELRVKPYIKQLIVWLIVIIVEKIIIVLVVVLPFKDTFLKA